MDCKSVSLSFDGLKNVVPSAYQGEDDFSFLFGDKTVKMNSIYADFISPAVSRLHHFDPTINTISFDQLLNSPSNSQYLINHFDDESLMFFKQIASGNTIEINEEQALKIRVIAIVIDNQELFIKLNEIFPKEIDDTNFDLCLQDLLLFYNEKQNFQHLRSLNYFNYSSVINYMASNFYSFDQNKLLQLPRSILYKIITNENLKLVDEDSLIDFIQKVFNDNELNFEEEDEDNEDENDEEKINIISFYEAVDFMSLSESKFEEFSENFESRIMTKRLWRKLSHCFYTNFAKKGQKRPKNKKRYLSKDVLVEFDGDDNHCFNGIIHKLTEESGGNVAEVGKVKVTSSPPNGSEYISKHVVDFGDNNYFQSKNEINSWIKYDFQDSKVHPTHYSIKTRHDGGKGDNHPKNWVIEGSNTDNGVDWKILDARNDVTVLDDGNAFHTFDIKNPLQQDESYRFLRLRQTGPNTQDEGNFYFLTLSALEYFGVLVSD